MCRTGLDKYLIAMVMLVCACPQAAAQAVDLTPITLPATASSTSAIQHAFQWWTPVYLDVPCAKILKTEPILKPIHVWETV